MTKALVIDDNRLIADILCSILENLDIRSVSALGPRAAFLILKDYQPDIIFLDINMPGLSGFEVLRYLSREPNLKDIPVIVVTSDESPATAKSARQEGALDVIVKPVSLETIMQVLTKAGFPRS